MTGLQLVAAAGVVVAATGIRCSIALRSRVRQDPRPAHAFCAIGIAVLLLGVGVGVALGSPLAAVPTVAVGALCLAAGCAFHPTPGSRFAEFERAFRDYADRHVHHRP